MGKKKKKKPAQVQTKPAAKQKNTNFEIKPWLKYLLVVLYLMASAVYLYQEQVLEHKFMNISDIQNQGLPFSHYRKTFEAEHHEPALWLPHIFAGMPFHASGSYHVSYNIQTAYQLIPKFIRRIFPSGMVMNIIFGAIFMFLLLRSYGVGAMGGLAGAVIFAFTTKLLGTPHTNRIATFIHIPLIFYAVKEIMKKPQWWLVFILGGAVGSQLGSYHPQVSHFTGIFIGLYILYEIYLNFREKKGVKPLVIRGGYLLSGLIIALMLAAIVILPMKEYLPYSIRGAQTAASTGTSGGLSSSYATQWSLGWTEIITFIFPSFAGYGNETYWGQMPFTTFPNYLGIIAVIMSFFYFLTAKDDKYRWFWLGSFFIVLAIALGRHLPPVSYLMLHFVPFYNKFREPALITILNSFIVGVSAGLFFKYLKNPDEETKTILLLWIKRLAIVFGSLMIIFVLFQSFLYDFFTGIFQSADAERGRYTQYTVAQLQPLYKMRFSMITSDIIRNSLFALASLGILYAYLRNKAARISVSLGLLILISVDLFIPGRQAVEPQYSRRKASETFDRGNKVADWLKEHEKFIDYRVFPIDNFQTNEYVYYGIPSIGGYHAVKMANFQAYLDEIGLNNFQLLNMLSVKYFITKKSFQLPGTKVVAKIDGNNIYLNNNRLPFVRFADEVTAVKDKDQIIKDIKSNKVNLRKTALVSGGEPPFSGIMLKDSSRSIEIKQMHGQLLKIETHNKYDGFMVVSEMHYPPGWRAYIDDQPTEIFLVNAGIMGIAVPSGGHNITLRYEQPSFFIANTVSRITYWLVLLVLLGLAGRKIYFLNKGAGQAANESQ